MGKNFVVLGGPTRAEKVDRLVKDPKAWARALTSQSELAALAGGSLAARRPAPMSFMQVLVRVLGVATLVAGAAVITVLLGWATYGQLAWVYLGLSVVAAIGLLICGARHSRWRGFRRKLPACSLRRGLPSKNLEGLSYPDVRDEAYGWFGYHRNMENNQDLDI